MAAIIEIDYWVDLGPLRFWRKERPISTDHPWKRKIGHRADILSYGDGYDFFLEIPDPRNPRARVIKSDGVLDDYVVRVIEGEKFNNDPDIKGRLRFIPN